MPSILAQPGSSGFICKIDKWNRKGRYQWTGGFTQKQKEKEPLGKSSYNSSERYHVQGIHIYSHLDVLYQIITYTNL